MYTGYDVVRRLQAIGCDGCAVSIFPCEKCREEADKRRMIKRAIRRTVGRSLKHYGYRLGAIELVKE